MKHFNLIFYHAYSLFLLGAFSSLSAQDVQWQQVLGGIHSEYLYDMKSTPDYGFLLAGSSLSGETGNKAEKSKGNLDYFLWKMNESGRLEWQKSFGGSGNDFLYSVELTRDGGFILGGSSDSPVSGDKKEAGFGHLDFWIIKLDFNGEEEWQKTIGGIGNDQLLSIQQTADGGYIAGGTSDSSMYFDDDDQLVGQKTEDSRGAKDYWIVKLSANGELEWEKTYGGNFNDELNSILITEDGYLLAGTSNSLSPYSGQNRDFGDKTSQHFGMSDFWIIKTDEKGNIQWQKSYGGEGKDQLMKAIKTENGFLLAGNTMVKPDNSNKLKEQKGMSFWVLEIDDRGDQLWEKTYEFGQSDVLVSAVKLKDNNYLLGGYTFKNTFSKNKNPNASDYIAIKINQKGDVLWNRTIGGDAVDRMKAVVQTRDGGYLLAGNSDSGKQDDKDRGSNGRNDYWLVKLGNENKQADERKLVEVYPNPTDRLVNIIITQEFKQAKAQIFDMNGQSLQMKDLPYQSTGIDLQSYPPGVYIFKIIVDGEIESVKVIKRGNK